MRSPAQDVGYGLRLIRRSPGFAVVVVITLALGIGTNTAIFSVLNALLLRSLPVAEPDRLVELDAIYRNGAKIPFSFPLFQQLQENQRVFSQMFAWTGGLPRNLEIEGRLSLSMIRGVTGNYYGALGAAPLIGRLVGPEDTARIPGASVAVLGYEFWEREFGRDPTILGKTLRIDGQPFSIVGVSRKWFTGMTPGDAPDITIPVTSGFLAHGISERAIQWLFLTGRLKDGVTAEQARAQLGTFWRQSLSLTAPTAVPGPRLQSWMAMGIEVTPAATGVNRDLRKHFSRPLRVLIGVAALILLVACVNLASLTLARAVVRSGEMSVRLSLGATRVEIVRQFLTESVLLSVIGAVVALAFVRWTSHLLVALIGGGLAAPVILDVVPDWRVFAFALLVSITTGVLIALGPAWQISKQQPSAALLNNERTASRSTGRLGKALIVTQIALSFVLLLGAGLLLRTFQNLRSSDPQYQRSGVLQVVLQARPDAKLQVPSNFFDANWESMSVSDELNSYRKELLEGVTGLPGVISASFAALQVPSVDRGWRDTVSETSADSSAQPPQTASFVPASPGFFRTLGIPIVAGRDFDWADDHKHPRVVIVDTNLAHQLNPAGNVIGKQVRFGVQPRFQQMEIVGVVQRARLMDLRDPSVPIIYIPSSQEPAYSGNLFVRAQNPAGTEKMVERELQTYGQEYAVVSKTLDETSEQALAEDRATAMLSSIFAGLALLLVGIGLFGLMSYAVTRRTREIGIRLALGSQRMGILRLVLSESLLITVVGIGIGVPCALLAARFLTHVLFGVTAADPPTVAIAAAALLCVGVVGGYWPARRAMRTDPITALRCE